jgi:hypothetical protein
MTAVGRVETASADLRLPKGEVRSAAALRGHRLTTRCRPVQQCAPTILAPQSGCDVIRH